MLDANNLLRLAAVVAAVAVVAGPWLVGAGKAALQRLRSVKPIPAEVGPDDTHTVLEIAQRLKASGNAAGVSLCQQLIDVMLNPKEQKK
jgi:hypothetical protein